MATITKTKQFRHDNDCLISGCPGHTMTVTHQTTSDSFMVEIDGKIVYGGDDNTTRTMLELIKEVDY